MRKSCAERSIAEAYILYIHYSIACMLYNLYNLFEKKIDKEATPSQTFNMDMANTHFRFLELYRMYSSVQ